jgi:hypothetical protein
MFAFRASVPRRTFLKGVGATVALPLLDAMVPSFTALAQTSANGAARRFGAVYIPHGVIMSQWTPSAEALEITPILKPLEPFRDQLVVVSNLTRPVDREGGTHSVSMANWLTGAVARRTIGEDFRAGTSIDQVIAKKVGQDTLLPSLELATEDFSGQVGACDPGYSCTYLNTLSWASPTTPLPCEMNPRSVFERMFGRTGTAEQRLARIQEDRSILDALKGHVRDLERGLGSQDRRRLGDYLDNIREIERRIQKIEAQNASTVTPLDAPIGVPESFAEHIELMFDMLAVAYQAEITRVFTFTLARELSMRTYPELDITDPHHPLSHMGREPEKVALHAKLNTYHVSMLAKFIGKLRDMPDGDGSVLDHSMIVYGSGMSDGNTHSPAPLALIAVGGAAGKGNRHVLAPKSQDSPTGNLWLSVAEKYGIPMNEFGVSTGRVEI